MKRHQRLSDPEIRPAVHANLLRSVLRRVTGRVALAPLLLLVALLVAACSGSNTPPAQQVDLRLHDVTVGSPVTEGQALSWNLKIANLSSVTSPEVVIRITLVPAGGGGSIVVHNHAFMAVPAGQTFTSIGSKGMPETVVAGTYTVVIELDPDRTAALTNRADDRVELQSAFTVEEAEPITEVEMCKSPTDLVTFPDAVVRHRVQTAVGVGVDLTCANVATVTALTLEGAGVTTLEGMQNMTGLVQLNISSNYITDVSYLIGMTSLEWLQMATNEITSLQPLRNHPRLLSIEASGNPITSMAPLVTVPTLHTVRLFNTDIAAIPDLSPLVDLLYLGISSRYGVTPDTLKDASGVAGLTAIRELVIATSGLTTLEPFSELHTLEHLTVMYSHIEDASPVAGLQGLKYLTLNNNLITDATPFGQIANLQQLIADDNKIRDLGPFSDYDRYNLNTSLNFRRNCFPVDAEGSLFGEQLTHYEELTAREARVNWEPRGTTEWCGD